VIINELDKVGAGMTSTSGTRSSMSDALLPLLDPTTAARFRCPASGLDCDLSRILWIATANEGDRIDPVLRSRLEAVEVPALDRDDLEQYVDLVIPEEDRGTVRRMLADLPVGPRLTLRHVRRLADRLRGSYRPDPVH
jgi:ATP-dependent Lon protease